MPLSDEQRKALEGNEKHQYIEFAMTEQDALSILAHVITSTPHNIFRVPIKKQKALGEMGPGRLRIFLPVKRTEKGLATKEGPLQFDLNEDGDVAVTFEIVPQERPSNVVPYKPN